MYFNRGQRDLGEAAKSKLLAYLLPDQAFVLPCLGEAALVNFT
jgi:hypothetical protein